MVFQRNLVLHFYEVLKASHALLDRHHNFYTSLMVWDDGSLFLEVVWLRGQLLGVLATSADVHALLLPGHEGQVDVWMG